MTTAAAPSDVPAPSRVPVARALTRLAGWLEVYSEAALRIAKVTIVVSAFLALVGLVGNIFTREALGFSLFGSGELARFAFLWTIWMGVSIAVKRSTVTVITLLSDNGPAWWRHSVRTFSGLALAVLLSYCCWRATLFASGEGAPRGLSPALGISWFYPVVSMTVGYYFITLHYAHAVVSGAARLFASGVRVTALTAVRAVAGALALGAAVWLVMWLVLEGGGSPLLAIAILFVALTMAGTPVVFMLSIVGIVAMAPNGVLGLEIYPNPSLQTPFSTTQFTMGLSGGLELLTILMFLIVAEVMNASGMSARLIAFAASLVAHVRGGMAYVCQLTSMVVSGISGSAQADAAIMTPLLVPAMEREGYRRDVAAAVVAGASIKGPIGPLSIMFIVYGVVVSGAAGASISKLLLSGVLAEILLFLFQAATVYVVVRKMDFLQQRRFAGWGTVGRTGLVALPVLAIPVIILGGIFSGVFTAPESASIAAVVTIGLALFWYAGVSPRQLPTAIVAAGVETGIVMLLLGDSSILASALEINHFGATLEDFLTGISDNKYVFLLVVNLLLLAVGIFIEPLPALYILAPVLAPVAVIEYGIDPVHFGLIMVFNLVLALIHPPIGLVIFLVSSIAKVPVERLSIVILPWLAVSLVVLFLITYLPSSVVLALSNLID
ncbi:MAG: TRAP transporter large permease subunit [Thermoleophilia bacterium]